jgi:hypothetical protein
MLIFFAWLFLYVFFKRFQPAKGLFSSSWSEEVIYIIIAAYGAFFGAYFLVANLPLTVAFTLLFLHLLISREVVRLAMHTRKMKHS